MTGAVMVIVGARPQFMKAAPLMPALAARGLTTRLIHTGQHFDPEMSRVFFDELDLPEPDVNLGVSGGGHGAMTGRMLEALEALIVEDRPAAVVVFGDTNSTLAGALAAAKLGVPVAHVEAGLRSFDPRMPEEVNRRLTDHVSTLLLCPTREAERNLRNEAPPGRIVTTGDIMYDTVLALTGRARAASGILERLGLEADGYAVATLHRASTTGSRKALSKAVDWLRARAAERPVVLPLHPRTRSAAGAFGVSLDGLTVIDPLGPLDMQRLLAGCAEVFTDSGGLQKEAYFHRKPCTTLRDETEWPETVEAGWNRLWTGEAYAERREIDDYGDGDAAGKIADALVELIRNPGR